MTWRLILGLTLAAGLALGADLTGTWDMEIQTAAGSGNPTFTFKQAGEKLDGTYRGLFGEAKVTGLVRGDAVEFEFKSNYEGTEIEVKFKGALEGADSMKGTAVYTGLGEGTWTAKRRK